MSKEIIRHKPNYLSSFEAFKKFVLNLGNDTTPLIRAANTYSKIPAFLRIAQNFDPTGLAGSIDQLLSETIAQNEQDKVLLEIYELTKAFVDYGQRLEKLEKSSLESKFPVVTYLYFEHSERTIFQSKIKLFKNIWLNSILAEDRSSSEASIVFDIIQSLTEDEIRALKFIYQESRKEKGGYKHIRSNCVAEALGIEPAYAQQLCLRLRSQGLIGESSEGMTIGSTPPVIFMLTDFTEILIKYISEPMQ